MRAGSRLVVTLAAVGWAVASISPAQANQKRGRSLYPKHPQRLHRSFVPPAARKIRVAFLDADSTLRVSKSGLMSPNKPSDVALLPMIGPKIANLVKQGYLIAVVSNQGGVEKGYVTKDAANRALRKTCKLVSKQPGCAIHYYDFAPRYDGFRKPGTGMGDQLAAAVKRKYRREIDWENSIMVGDAGWKRKVDREPSGRRGEDHSNSDRCFAEALRSKYGCTPKGMAFHHPRDFFGWSALGVRNFNNIKNLGDFMQAHPAASAPPR